MSEDLGYKPAKGPDGSGNYSHKRGNGNAHAKSKKRQDGVGQKDSVNSGDHLWDHDMSEGELE